jgi:hypothetical protein
LQENVPDWTPENTSEIGAEAKMIAVSLLLLAYCVEKLPIRKIWTFPRKRDLVKTIS